MEEEAATGNRGPNESDSRRCVAGGPAHFMTVYHLILSGSQAEIGHALAGVAQAHSGWQPSPVTDPLRNRARRRWFERHWPQQYERMIGVAAACGRQLDADKFDCSNVMAEPVTAQCSAVWCSPNLAADGHARVGRNLDFTTRTVSELLGEPPLPGEPPALARPYVVEMRPDEGPSSLVTVIGDLTGCLDGINDRGLTVAMLADDETPSLRPSGMPQSGLSEMHVLRFLLDTCSSAEEAKEALFGAKQYDEYAVAHYLIADDEQAFVWERDTHNAEHVVSMDGETLSVTNFLLFREGVSSIPEDLPENTQAHDAYRRARCPQRSSGRSANDAWPTMGLVGVGPS